MFTQRMFMKKITMFPKTKTSVKRVALFYIFASLLSHLIEDSWIFISTSAFNVW